MNKLLASVAAVALLASTAAFAGPDTGTSSPAMENAAPAAMEEAPAKADAAPMAKKHGGKHHAGKKHAGHKKGKKAVAK